MINPPPVLPLFGYQQRWLDDQSQLKICNKARQIGITFIETLSIVMHLMGQRSKWYYLSISEDRAAEAIEYAILHARALGVMLSAQDIERGFFEDTQYKYMTITFPNGSKLIGLPANPRTARGCSGNVTLDEFAHHHDAKKIWTAVIPVITWGYLLRSISTPNGLQGEFARVWTGGHEHTPDSIESALSQRQDIVGDKWSRHCVNIEQAALQGHPVDVEACRELAGDSDTFQQEYMCKFLDEAHSWLPYSLLDESTTPEASIFWDHSQRPTGPVWAGFDVGHKHDLSVIWLNEQRGTVHTTRGVIAMRATKFSEQQKVLWDLMPTVRRVCIDETGIGAQLAEDATAQWGENQAEGISFTGDRPAKLATKLRRALETKTLQIPDCADVRKDLHAVRRTYTDLGKVRFEAPRTRDGHADRFWAAALALNASDYGTMPLKPGDYKSVKDTGRPRLRIGRDWNGY